MLWLKYDTGKQQAKKYFSKERIFTKDKLRRR